MKSYTDIEQSKKLAEILPIESADMYWKNGVSNKYIQCLTPFVIDDYGSNVNYDYDIPCWSLAALFKILPIFTKPTAFSIDVSVPSVTKTDNGWLLKYNGDFTLYINNGKDTEAPVEFLADNPIDAAFEMVCWLKENGKI